MSLEKLNEIRAILAPSLNRTPILRSSGLDEIVGCQIFFKAEVYQKTGSFKPRGMLWALMQLNEEQKRRGVITFSAGNAAQGLAYVARQLNVQATVIMPEWASQAKIEATRAYGAEVIQNGSVQECMAFCYALAEDRGYTLVPSYDHPDVMDGHASIGLEIIEEVPDCAAIYTPIGGGGLAGGISLALQAANYTGELVGIEPHGAACMRDSMTAGKAIALDHVNTIADGLAAPTAGRSCFEILSRTQIRLAQVSDPSILAALELLLTRTKIYTEPAGATAFAGLISEANRWNPSDKVVVVVSGGNIAPQRLGELFAA